MGTDRFDLSDAGAAIVASCGDDAAKWAAAFVAVIGERDSVIDEPLMTAWFANAIESRPRPTSRVVPIDACRFCNGSKGRAANGIIQGARVCVECAELFMELFEASVVNSVKAPPADVASGAVMDDNAEADGALIRATNDAARQIESEERDGLRISFVTPFGGTVTDPDELEMYKQLAARNITVCGDCYNTGWRIEGEIICECPVGSYLAIKLEKLAAAGKTP